MKNLLVFFLLTVISLSSLAQRLNIDSVNTKIHQYKTFNYSNVVYEDDVKGLHFMNVIKEITFNADCSLDIIYYSDWRFIRQKESEVSYHIPMGRIKGITSAKAQSVAGYKEYTHNFISFECTNDEDNIIGNVIAQKNENSKDEKEKIFKTSAISFAYEGNYLKQLLVSLNSIRQRCSAQ